MRKTPLSLLIGLFILFSNIAVSQCQYSFSSFGQTVYLNGDPSMTNVNTLSTCAEYVFDYSIQFSSTSITSVTDDITIELPLNVSFQSLVSSNGTVTVNSSTANSVSLNVSGWTIGSTPLNIKVAGVSSSCDASTVTGNPLAEVNGDLACGTANSANGVTIVSPQLLVDLYGTAMKNIGDVDEIVFKIRNTGGNGTVIQNLLMDYTLNANIESYLNTYYISGSATQGTGNNIYTYTLPGGVFTSTTPAGTIPIDPADFQNVLGHGYLGNNEEIYLHIPYFVNSCGGTTGIFNFKRDCGNSSTCDNVEIEHNLTVLSGNTIIGSGNVIPLVDPQNGTFCSTAGSQNTELHWKVYGSNSNPTGGPYGYTRATDMQLLVLVDNSFGAVDPATFTISNGASTINVSSVTSLVDPAFLLLGGATTGSLYKIDLSQLAVVGSNWQPLGTNSLADLDGDGYTDDLIEQGTFEINVDYTYNTTCPLYQDHGGYYTISTLEWFYKNACGVPVNNSAIGGNFSWYVDASTYGYTATGNGGELNIPPDVLASEPFVSELCFAPYYENYSVNGFGFDCPNGFHRVIYEIPNGYHLDVSGLTASSTPGWYELPDMTVTSVAGANNPTAQVSPIVQEYCNPSGTGRIIEVRFGLIPWDLLFYGRPTTLLLPCLDLPMYLDCGTSDPSCPGLPNNFGFDDMDFRLEYVCDETCSSCSSFIVGGHASTYHHCPGECASYFGTDPHPVFERSSLGYVNTTTGYIMGSDLTSPSNLTTSTDPTIDLEAAYPGDQVSLQVGGSFYGSPGVGYTANTGASYNDIYLQIRYDDLPPGERKYARIFDLEQLSDDEILITENSPINGISTYSMPVSTLTMTDFVSAGVVHLNINFSSGGLAFMDESNATYSFSSDLHLRVRSEPISSGNHYFWSPGKHIITSLRFEYKGTETDGETIDGSCDDYGANFKVLQASAYAPDGPYIGEATYCGENEIYFRFYNDAALFQINNDFPNEYRAYGQLSPDITVTIPPGYTFVSAAFVQDGKEYDAGLPNNFDPDYMAAHITIPMTPYGPSTTDMYGNTLITFKGINNSTWPALDLEHSTGGQYIYLKIVPDCDIPVHSDVYVSGEYTLGVNQDLAAYQHTYSFTTQIPLGHYEPNINIINPVATVNAYDGTAEFTFSVCNESGLMTGPANQAWFAFENSAIDGLDLTGATLINTSTNTPVTFTTYTDANGHQAIIVNYGQINTQACVNFKLIVHVSSNGCVNGSTSVADYLTVYGGNSCDGSVLTEPTEPCTNETTQFAFNRYPSDLELILPEDAYPTTPVEMCNGILEYNFILNSYEVGGVSDVEFWTDLPNGLTLSSITFSNPGGTPTSATLTSYDGTTYGSGGNLPGWDVLNHLGMPYLPGAINANHDILVHLEVQSSCEYDLTSPVLCYANSINSCGQQTDLLEMSSTPLISNVTLANDLVITPTITFSDSTDTLSCNNTATVTLTITNNSSTSNLTDLDVVAQVPGSPLIINPGTGTHTGNEVTWSVPANTIPANSTVTVSYTITNPGVICQNDVPMSASIQFSQDVSCTSTGGSCNVEMTTDTVYFDIDVCCNCDLVLELSSEPKHCKYYGSATADVSGGSGTFTYLWSDGQTTSTAVNLVPGTYTVTVTDEEGCTKTNSVVVGDISGSIVITATVDQDTVCSGDTVNITPGGGSSYSLTDGSINLGSTGAPFVVNPTTTTTYTIYGNDEFGCSGDTTITITVIPLDTPSFHINDQYCYGETISALPTTSLNGITGTWSPSSISNTTNGTYVFTPDAGQCAATFTLSVTINPLPTVTVNSDTICAGQSATLTASGASMYYWSPSGTLSAPTGSTVTATPSATTTYTVTGENEYGCTGTATATVTVNSNVTPTFAAVGPYCSGASIPALPTTSTNGVSGTWSPAINNTATTTYTFTPTEGQCATTTTLTITITPNVTPTFKLQDNYCYGASIPALPTTSTNGVSGTWSPAINNTATTTYTFTPTAGQCATTVTFTITINPNVTPTFTAVGPYCSGATIPALPTTSTNAITGSWSPAINNTATTTYTFTPNPGQCATTTTLTITINPNVTPTFNDAVEGPYCYGSTLPALPTTSNNGITGTWSPALNNTATTTYTFTPTAGQCATTTTVTVYITPLTTPVFTQLGPYCEGTTPGTLPGTSNNGITGTWSPSTISTSAAGTTTYTFTPNSGQCASTATMNITVVKIPNAPVISSNTPVCAGNTINLFANTIAGATYTWSGPGGYASSLEDPTRTNATTAMSGTYSCTITLNGCTSSAAATSVVVNALPAAPTVSNTGPYCAGNTIVLNANTISGATYAWTGPGGYTSSLEDPTRTGSTTAMSGTYSCTVTVGGCTSAAATTNVVVNAIPAAPSISSNTPVCAGNSINLFANTISGATYLWSGPGGYTSSLEDPTRTGATAGMAGNYNCTVTVNGCTSSQATTTVVVNAVPSAPTVSNTGPYCAGNTIVLNANTISGATYAWSGPGGYTSSLEDPTRTSATTAMSGNYSCTVTVNGCASNAATTNVTVNPLPAVLLSSNSPVCAGNTLNLYANTVSGATYVWTGPSSYGSSAEDPVRNVATTSMSGTYNCTITTSSGCSSSASISVTVNKAPTVPVVSSNTPVCSGNTITLFADTQTGATYSWTGPASFSSSLEDPTRSSATTAMSGNYVCTVSVPGCVSAQASTSVTVNQTPAALTLSSNSPVCPGSTIFLTANTVSGGTYAWTGPSFSSSLQNPNRPSATTAMAGTYNCKVTVNGCQSPNATTSVLVTCLGLEQSNVVEEYEAPADGPVLSVNPNPTTGSTSVLVDGVAGKMVEVELFNMLGERVAVLYSAAESKEAMLRLVWNAADVTPGVYLVKAKVGNKTMMEKVVVSH